MAAVLVLIVGGLVVGGGALANHAPGSGTPVSSESNDQNAPQAVPSRSASPSPTRTRHAAHTPTAQAEHHKATRTPTARKKKRKTRRKAVFTGVSHVLLKNTATHLCADLPDFGKGTVNGPVNQYPCTMGSADNQVWSLGALAGPKGPGGAHLFQIRNAKDELCMDLGEYGARPAGTKVIEYPCHPTTKDNQLWFLSAVKGGGHLIRNQASHGLCLGPTGRMKAGQNARLEIHTCGHGDVWAWSRGG